jgi:hypothetical protein
VDRVVRLDRTIAAKLVLELRNEFYVSEAALEEAISRRSCANLIHLKSNFKVDLMISKERDYEASSFARRRIIEVGVNSFHFCSPEDIILAKLEWYRASGNVLERQLRDIQTVMMVQQELDLDYLRHWASRLRVGERLEQSIQDAGLESP